MIQAVNSNHPEVSVIWDALPNLALALMTRLHTKGATTLSFAALLDNVREHARGFGRDYHLITAGPCIVGYNVVQTWWSEQPMYMEEFIIRYKPGNFADTIKDLELHALGLGCKDLVISSLAMIRQESYGEYLKRKGFREVAREYVKGVS